MENKKQISIMSKVIAVLLFLAALGHTSASILPLIAGQEPTSSPNVRMLGFILWYGLFCMVIMSWRGKKRLIGFLTGSVIGFIFFTLIGVFTGYKKAESRAIAKVMQESNANLPIMIDEYTRLDRVELEQKRKEYTYFLSVVDLAVSEIDISVLNENFFERAKPQICKNDRHKVFFNEGYSVSYSYYDKDNVYIVSYSIEPDDCPVK